MLRRIAKLLGGSLIDLGILLLDWADPLPPWPVSLEDSPTLEKIRDVLEAELHAINGRIDAEPD